MEGMVTRKVELRGIGIFSAFKLFFAIQLIFSFVFYILFNLFGVQIATSIAQIVANMRQFYVDLRNQFPVIFANEFISSFFASVIGGFIVGLMAALGALIFSFFAGLFGGLGLKIREKNVEKKTGYL